MARPKQRNVNHEDKRSRRIRRAAEARGTHIAVNDLVVLRGLDDLHNLLDGPVYVCADPTNDDNVLGRGVISIRTKLDGQSLVLADDTIQGKRVSDQ